MKQTVGLFVLVLALLPAPVLAQSQTNATGTVAINARVAEE